MKQNPNEIKMTKLINDNKPKYLSKMPKLKPLPSNSAESTNALKE